jgi:hypothetical protein
MHDLFAQLTIIQQIIIDLHSTNYVARKQNIEGFELKQN